MPFIALFDGQTRPYHPPQVRQLPELEPVARPARGRPVGPRTSPDAAPRDAYRRAETSASRRRVVRAEELMSSPVISCRPDTPLTDVRTLMERNGFRHMPVVCDSMLVGLISDRDLGRPAKGEAASFVRERMSRELIAATPDTPVREVARALLDRRIGCLPIITRDRRLIGILTLVDILRGLLMDAPLELWV